ncbi:TPA: hypothetical protein U2M10_002176 [Klebsiella aerogenes]|nr:hypothetical protein [Klebsiella aerogenes]
MKKIALVLTILSITGCASTVVPPSKALSAPQERVFKYQVNTGEKTTLTIIRDAGIVGSGCYAAVYLNGEQVAKLNPKEKAIFYISEGEWAVGANLTGKGLCSLSTERQERMFNVKGGENKVVRVFTDSNANVDIRPTTIN